MPLNEHFINYFYFLSLNNSSSNTGIDLLGTGILNMMKIHWNKVAVPSNPFLSLTWDTGNILIFGQSLKVNQNVINGNKSMYTDPSYNTVIMFKKQ